MPFWPPLGASPALLPCQKDLQLSVPPIVLSPYPAQTRWLQLPGSPACQLSRTAVVRAGFSTGLPEEPHHLYSPKRFSWLHPYEKCPKPGPKLGIPKVLTISPSLPFILSPATISGLHHLSRHLWSFSWSLPSLTKRTIFLKPDPIPIGGHLSFTAQKGICTYTL